MRCTRLGSATYYWLRPIGLAFAPLMYYWLRPIGLAFAPLMYYWLRPIGLAFAPLMYYWLRPGGSYRYGAIARKSILSALSSAITTGRPLFS
jgi:hypothetical protein